MFFRLRVSMSHYFVYTRGYQCLLSFLSILSMYLPTHITLCLSVYLSINLSIYLPIYPSISAYLSVYLFISLSSYIFPSIVCLFTCLLVIHAFSIPF